MVNTVLGPMETSEMGRTLMHEHAVCFDIALKKAFGKKWVDEDAAIEQSIIKDHKNKKGDTHTLMLYRPSFCI